MQKKGTNTLCTVLLKCMHLLYEKEAVFHSIIVIELVMLMEPADLSILTITRGILKHPLFISIQGMRNKQPNAYTKYNVLDICL